MACIKELKKKLECKVPFEDEDLPSETFGRTPHCKDLQKTSYGKVHFRKKIFSDRKNASKSNFRNQTYTTLQLIENLFKELKSFKCELAHAFPEKIKKYPHISLSRLWKGKNHSNFIFDIKLRFEIEGIYEAIDSKDLQLLRLKLNSKYGKDKLIYCFKVIEKYETGEISIIDMIDELTIDLGRIVNNFPVTKKILSKLFGMEEGFISKAVERRIKKQNRKDYNPNYKFSLEHLETLSINLYNILGNNSKKCFHFIREYNRLNPNLKEYSHQKYNCTNPHAFKELNVVSSYWLGFFVADVYINEDEYKIQLSLSIKDRDHLETLAEFVGIDKEYIYEYNVYIKYKGKIREYRIARLSFGCKSMVEDIRRLGFFEARGEMNKRRLPYSILSHIIKVNKIGEVALSFLHGFFDGDGHYHGGLCGSIFSSSKPFLEQLKRVYSIDNEIRMSLHKSVPDDSQVIYVKELQGEGIRPSYHLTLGVELYRKMIKSYNIGLKRKIPSQERDVLTIRYNY